MLKVLLFTILMFILVFLEHFVLKVVGLSLFAFFGIYLWSRWGSSWYFVFFLFLGIVLDVTMHLSLGVHFIVLAVSLLFVLLAKSVIPIESAIQQFLILLISTFIFYILFLVLPPLVQDFVLPNIVLKDILNVAIKSVVTSIIYTGISISTQSFRGRDFEKIRLR